MQRMPHGFAHGEAPADRPVIVLKLKAGWALAPDGGSVEARRRRVTPALPAGARLVPALPLPPLPTGRGRRTPAERELARFVHLRLPDGLAAGEALALARSWAFVERAELPPSLSLT